MIKVEVDVRKLFLKLSVSIFYMYLLFSYSSLFASIRRDPQ